MNCTQQYISKMLKGQKNMSLETICKIENTLSIEIIKGPERKRAIKQDNGERKGENTNGIVNESVINCDQLPEVNQHSDR